MRQQLVHFGAWSEEERGGARRSEEEHFAVSEERLSRGIRGANKQKRRPKPKDGRAE
jgi:hypothetical protein